MDRNGSGVVCEDRFPVMGNDTHKDPVMGKFSKYMRLASQVQQKKQQRIKWNKWVGTSYLRTLNVKLRDLDLG